MIKMSEQSNDLFTALIKAQAEFKVAIKDVKNDFTKKNYADFQSVVDAARPALVKHSLGFMQMPVDTEKGMMLITRIFHTSGQWVEGCMPVRTMKDDPQSLGAALTYSKRYALQSALGIVASDEDSDAETAMKRDDPARTASKADITNLVKAFQGIGVTQHQMLTYIGVKDPLSVSEGDLELLKSIGAEIKSGKAKKDAYFQ